MTQEIEVFVHAVYLRETEAAEAVQALLNAHFAADKIGALMCRSRGVEELGVTHKTSVGPGAILGAVFGALGGMLVTVSGVLLAGPAFLAVEGAFAGAAVGTLAGTLGGLGFWKEEIDFPLDAFVASGAVLVGISTDEARIELARHTLTQAGAATVHVSSKRAAGEATRTKVRPASVEANPTRGAP